MSYTTWGEISRIASSAGAKYPELVAAQWALESGWGANVSGKNNVFGIKGKGTKVKTTEFVNGKEVVVYDEFMDFANITECVQYLVERWYRDYQNRYMGVNRAKDRDAAAKMLVTEGYATDPLYAEKLIKLMNTNTPGILDPIAPQAISLKNAAKHYTEQPHQILAWDQLQNSLTKEQLDQFAVNYRKQTDKPKFPLDVPYFYQRDSKTGHGERSCQSSAIAMVLEYLSPNLIKDDDDYLNTVFRFGDTVSQNAHKQALDYLHVKNKFLMNGTEQDLIRILDLGYPVPIGILHKGNIENPSGGGHYITLTGYDSEYFYVNDPFGELDLVNGGYPLAGPTDGRRKKYTRKNLMKRWLIHSSSDGWYWDFSENKKLP